MSISPGQTYISDWPTAEIFGKLLLQGEMCKNKV